MVFYSKKDVLFKIFLILYSVFTLFMLFLLFKNGTNTLSNWFAIFILILTYLFVLSFWFFTYYKINDNYLLLKSGIIKVSIPIKSIRKIKVGETKWVGLKLGLAQKGLIIYYHKYDDVYISPSQVELFVETLTSLNPKIKVEKKTTN